MKVDRREFLKYLSTGGGWIIASYLTGLGFTSCGSKITHKKRIYILALDGLSGDYIFAKDQHGNYLMPNIVELSKEALVYTNCHAPLPAVTVCNHTAIVSGARPGLSGIYGAGKCYIGLNEDGHPVIDFYSPEDIQVETLFASFKRANPRSLTAVVTGKGWVGEAFYGSDCDILVTGYYMPDYIPSPQAYILGGEDNIDKCMFSILIKYSKDRVRGGKTISVPGLEPDLFPSDEWILQSSLAVIEKADPDFMYILFAGPDDAGHAYGNALEKDTMSTLDNPSAMRGQVRETDKCVGDFVKFLMETGRYDDSIIIITADHGMTSIGTRDVNIKGVEGECNVLQYLAMVDMDNPWIVDIRKILEDYGLRMKAGNLHKPYLPDGVYEYLAGEGPNAYIFGVEEGYIDAIVEALEDFNKNHPESPIALILTKDKGDSEIDPSTGFPYQLMNEKGLKGELRYRWPEIYVFLKKNYTFPLYVDLLRNGYGGFMKNMEYIDIDIATIPGLHGGVGEQLVPLLIIAPELRATTINERVSNLQIPATVARLANIPLPANAPIEPLKGIPP